MYYYSILSVIQCSEYKTNPEKTEEKKVYISLAYIFYPLVVIWKKIIGFIGKFRYTKHTYFFYLALSIKKNIFDSSNATSLTQQLMWKVHLDQQLALPTSELGVIISNPAQILSKFIYNLTAQSLHIHHSIILI